ncbi:uncharacterized protein K489DRAFT_374419 [Dissoconium aciculare CBS 342.82]|uniref:SANT domain-containing protein n=1 Tax=Dissoconium aciculare CBS 342.82 TaxID=1314786 RepID=A0A6J3LQT2_9PEZI|nr:uncharacterized protein K489DRAFT_374419 [Dissoconium aciculare CBS 342.82]KAF1818231.1 hypothetical protein K489DRAFT_374419 [Dissoconium aciculare CBS 342.82]
MIGYSCWSSVEKDALFTRLARSGVGDLRALSKAVGTKSESEVFVYLKLLGEQSFGQNEDAQAKRLNEERTNAAWEISQDCEDALNAAADSLAQHISKHETITEQSLHGDTWLITADNADAIDQRYEDLAMLPSPRGEDTISEETNTKAPATDGEHGDAETQPISPADDLLRSSAFLHLARTLFMNSATADSWHNLDGVIGPSQEPAMFRTALEDFFDLTVSLTRRLCLTALTQASTRLRSYAAQSPVPAVNAEDVRTACDILNVRRDRSQYWAGVPRRCKVNLYSNSELYNDGRNSFYPPGAHRPVRFISYEEAEKELSLEGRARVNSGESSEEEIDDDELDAAMMDDELHTDVSMTSDEGDGGDSNANSDALNIRERKRWQTQPMSQRRFLKIEEDILNMEDLHSSREEVDRLWRLLRLQPSTSPHANISFVRKAFPAPPHEIELQSTQWRQKIDWLAPWESENGSPAAQRFRETWQRGRPNRKRREALKKRLQERAISAALSNAQAPLNDMNTVSDGDSSDHSHNLDETPARHG